MWTERHKCYICGKVSGLDYVETFAKFEAAEIKLRRLGHEVVNPMKLIPYSTNPDWDEDMRICLTAMVSECSKIYQLPDWTHSPGAIKETAIAKILKFLIITDDIDRVTEI